MSRSEALRMTRDVGARVRRADWDPGNFVVSVPNMIELWPLALGYYDADQAHLVEYVEDPADKEMADWERVSRSMPDHPDFTDEQRNVPKRDDDPVPADDEPAPSHL
jgi:hypothetical protein